MFPDMFLATSISATSAERFHSSLRFTKNRMGSSMAEAIFNTLRLLCKQVDIVLKLNTLKNVSSKSLSWYSKFRYQIFFYNKSVKKKPSTKTSNNIKKLSTTINFF